MVILMRRGLLWWAAWCKMAQVVLERGMFGHEAKLGRRYSQYVIGGFYFGGLVRVPAPEVEGIVSILDRDRMASSQFILVNRSFCLGMGIIGPCTVQHILFDGSRLVQRFVCLPVD